MMAAQSRRSGFTPPAVAFYCDKQHWFRAPMFQGLRQHTATRAGGDVLFGGTGNDQLYGGAGADCTSLV